MAEALKVNGSVNTVYLGGEIPDIGAKDLAEMLSVNKSLTRLDLSSDKITDIGVTRNKIKVVL